MTDAVWPYHVCGGVIERSVGKMGKCLNCGLIADFGRTVTGTRIRLREMLNDPAPIEVGATGTIIEDHHGHSDDPLAQYWVDWDNGRTLCLVRGDLFEQITESYVINEEVLTNG